ncbi:hypothetical protein RB679 [Rhodopirellula baltica SH 1]|uniref:Uncharacterized protein n=1 Tax=Rhodopirellula baltica (strain DSM 10527 / NCIMB 13988 / SH1) TaxID=243090 RepID=Q7UYE4_RHOBA|nr:hypothetical protein RB679 [Rhodopirellula baltica SH 1]
MSPGQFGLEFWLELVVLKKQFQVARLSCYRQECQGLALLRRVGYGKMGHTRWPDRHTHRP